MDAKRERERLMEEISRFDWYFVEARKSPMPKTLSGDRAERGFTEEDKVLLSRSAFQLYQRCAFGKFAEGLLEDVLSAGEEEQRLGAQVLDRLHRFLEEYTGLLEQEAFWCK